MSMNTFRLILYAKSLKLQLHLPGWSYFFISLFSFESHSFALSFLLVLVNLLSSSLLHW